MRLIGKKDGMIMLGFPNRRELCMTMGRPQEFYESGNPKLRGKIFTQEQFLDAFTDDEGDVSYFKSWSGFNIPGEKLDEFMHFFTDLTKRERRLHEIVLKAVKDRGKLPYYVIAARDNDLQTMDHEIAHAMFYMDDGYRKAASRLVKDMDGKVREALEVRFKEWGYAKQVWVDELNAYMATSPASYMRRKFELSDLGDDMRPFRRLFNEYSADWK